MTKHAITYTENDFSFRFAKGLAKLKEKTWPTYDGKILDRDAYLTASEAGACLRKSAYEKGGYERSKSEGDKDWSGVQQRGDAVELMVVDALYASLDDAEETMFWFGVDQVSVYDDEAHLSATMDGLIVKRKTGWIIPHEIKSVDPRTQIEGWTGPRDKHRYQMVAGATILRHLVDNGKLKEHWPEIYEASESGTVRVLPYSSIIYVDANDLSRTKSFMVKTSFSPAEENLSSEIIQKGHALFPNGVLAKPEDMPAEGVLNGTCMYCDFKALCSAHKQYFAPESESKFKPPVARSATTTLMRNYALAQQRAKEATEVLEDLKPGIKKLIVEQGEREGNLIVLENGRYRGELAEVAGRKTLDAASVQQKLGGKIPEECYKVGAPSLRLTFETKAEDTKGK